MTPWGEPSITSMRAPATFTAPAAAATTTTVPAPWTGQVSPEACMNAVAVVALTSAPAAGAPPPQPCAPAALGHASARW